MLQYSTIDDINIDVLVQLSNVTTTGKFGTECASVSFNKFKLAFSCNPILSLYLYFITFSHLCT